MAVKKHELMPENNLGLLAHYLDISKAYYMLSPSDLIIMCKSLVVLLCEFRILHWIAYSIHNAVITYETIVFSQSWNTEKSNRQKPFLHAGTTSRGLS